MKTVTIDISPTGETKVEAHGFNGIGCKAATKAIEDALGGATDRKLKPEFNQAASQPRQVNQGS